MLWTTRNSASAFESSSGFSRSVSNDEWVFVAGTTGFDYETMTLPESAYEQTLAAWDNVKTALEAAGSSLDEIVNYTMVITDPADLAEVSSAMVERLRTKPAGMCLVAELVDPRLRYEVQVQASRGARVVAAEA